MKFFQLIPSNTNFDFIGKFKYFVAFSLITGSWVIYKTATGGLNYGIDFTGGSVIQVHYKKPTPAEAVRKHMADLKEDEATVAALGKEGQDYLITVRTITEKNEKTIGQKLVELLGSDKVEIQSADIVGPKVGKELKTSALLSLFYTVLLIMIYIWFRFDARFAPGAAAAMVHDLLLATGFYLLTGREFTITAVAALLTIAGYSVNDTIVIYDRVREMIQRGGNAVPLPGLINKAVNITLSRTILTSAITLISIIPIVFLTKGEIQSFAMVMCFGIFVGTYSTIYIASPFTIYAEKFLNRKKVKSPKSKLA